MLPGPNLIDRATSSTQERPLTTIPAVILVAPESSLQIAALTVLDRVVVAAHRAGAAPIIIAANGPLPSLKRTRALGISYKTDPDFSCERPVLLMFANCLVQAGDVRRCLESKARLLSSKGEPLSVGVVDSLPSTNQPTFGDGPSIRAVGVAYGVSDRTSAAAAEKALWASITSSSDGIVDKFFNRPCGRPLSKLLIHTPITPNAISVTSILIGVASAVLFSVGTPNSMILGAALLQLSAIIDCVDGDVARVVFKETAIGKWIDLAGDQIVHVGVFAGIALGVSKASAAPNVLWLGVSAVVGALLSFAVVLRGMRSASGQNSGLQRLIDAATNRDFSVLVLLLAFIGKMKIFLWLAAVGSHLFWIAALAVQLAWRAPEPSKR